MPDIPDQEIKINQSHWASRLTVVENVYHQAADENPIVLETRFSSEGKSQEQVYQRKLSVGKERVKVSLGWFDEDPSLIKMLVISNDEGRLQVIPTSEEKSKSEKQVLFVDLCEASLPQVRMMVRPGDSLRLSLTDYRFLTVQSATDDQIKTRITVFPG